MESGNEGIDKSRPNSFAGEKERDDANTSE